MPRYKGRKHRQRAQAAAAEDEEPKHARNSVPFLLITAIMVGTISYSIFRSQQQLKGILESGYQTVVDLSDSISDSIGNLTLYYGEEQESTTSVDPDTEFYNTAVTQQINDPYWQQSWNHCEFLWKEFNDTTRYMKIPPDINNWGLKQPRMERELPMTPGVDASVVITSNLIPSHPDIYYTNATLYSLKQYLIGLPKDTPIYISVDLPRPTKLEEGDNKARLTEYVRRLKATNYSHIFANVKVVVMQRHSYLAGSVYQTLTRHVRTPFFYLVQHDMPFIREINHTGLIQAMKTHPTVLNTVRFRLNNNPNTQKTCKNYTKTVPTKDGTTRRVSLDPELAGFTADNGLDFYVSDFFSDNNHISTKWFYLEMMHRFMSHYFAMELYMMTAAREHCDLFGQQLYGRRDDHQPFLGHLDGRQGAARDGGGVL